MVKRLPEKKPKSKTRNIKVAGTSDDATSVPKLTERRSNYPNSSDLEYSYQKYSPYNPRSHEEFCNLNTFLSCKLMVVTCLVYQKRIRSSRINKSANTDSQTSVGFEIDYPTFSKQKVRHGSDLVKSRVSPGVMLSKFYLA